MVNRRLGFRCSAVVSTLLLTTQLLTTEVAVPALHAQAAAQVPAQTPSRQGAAPTKSQNPDNIEWLTDAEGRQYRLEPIPKAQASKISDTQVRTIFGVRADLAKEDEKFFYIKLYKVGPPPPPVRPGRATPGKPSGGAAAGAAGAGAAAGAASARAAVETLPRVSQRLKWTANSAGLPTAGQWRHGLALVDLTGDGRRDIVVSGARKTLRPPTVFASDGKTWAVAPSFAFASRPYDYGALAIGDLNGDNIADVALGVHLKGLIALRGVAGGSFEDMSVGLPYASRSEPGTFSTVAVAVADCNGDRKPEILALGEGPRPPGPGSSERQGSIGVASFAQQPDGSWVPKYQPATDAVGTFGSGMAVGDFDGDGRVDVVSASAALGNNRIVHRGDGACGWATETVDVVRPRSYVTTVAAGDVNGDGRDEAVIGYTEFSADTPTYGVDVLSRGADGRWTRTALSKDSGRNRVQGLAVGDIDGDGAKDVVTVSGQGAATIFLGNGKGAFTRERQVIASIDNCEGAAVALGDLDGDGLSDIVIEYSQEVSSSAPGVCKNEGGIAAWKTGKAVAGAAPRAAAPKASAPASATPDANAPKPATSKPATAKPGR